MREKEVTIKVVGVDVEDMLDGIDFARKALSARGGLVNGSESYPEDGVRIWVNNAPKRVETD